MTVLILWGRQQWYVCILFWPAANTLLTPPKHFERLRRVMMGHENFDDMCERYQDAKAAGDDVDDPKLYTVKPVRPPNG